MKTLGLITLAIGGMFSITPLIMLASIVFALGCVKKYDEGEKNEVR